MGQLLYYCLFLATNVPFYLHNFVEKQGTFDSQRINSFSPLKIGRNVEIMGRGSRIYS